MQVSIEKSFLNKNFYFSYTQKYGSPDFLQISGGLLEFDFAQDEEKQLTLSQILCVDCNEIKNINDNDLYDVVMTEDLSKSTFSNENFTDMNKTDVSLLEKYIKQHQIVYPAIEDRIVLHNIDKTPEGGENSGVSVTYSTMLIGIMVLLQKFVSSV